MTMQGIIHHGFHNFAEARDRDKFEVEVSAFLGWLLLISVVGLTVFFVISFSLL